ncbi:hypothetical protein CALCODRAFT_302235 [Calocera cornea HHB12733]|uniref:Uncharacterized protein n=1 Tax=Calocera cornea HHB12733 TaxID=1353952 RepID=A0A165FIT2_9BASI|nr:hypothetical protein CALCODRAFT_302235 [Calocera cornea HHB12733]
MPIYAPNLPPPPDQMAAQRALAATQMSPSTDNNRADNLPSGSRPSRWGHVRERSPPPPGDGRDDFRRDDHRDDYRGRGRGRGRGPSDRGGPDRGVPDRGGSDRRGGRGGNRSPPPYGGRERSRSPPYRGPGGNRFNNRGPPGDERFPPRRESPVRNRSPPRYRSPPGRDAGLMAQSMARTDEFGREARGNDERIPPKASEGAEPRTELNTFQKSNTTSTSSAPPSSVAAPIPALPIAPKKGGLDAFDWTTFNFASPQSWDALGRAFQVTNGHLPSETEAMSLVMQQQMGGMMGGMMGQTVMGGQPSGSAARANGAFNNSGQSQPGWQNGGQNQSHQDSQRGARGRGRGRGSGRGGGFGYGRGGSGSDAGYAAQQNQQGSFASNQDSGWGNGGGQGWGASETQSWEVGNTNGTVVSDPPSAPSAPTSQAGDGESPISKKHGGQMVKIGDRWQWVPA